MVSHWAYTEGHREAALQLGARLGCVISTSIGKELSRDLMACLQQVDTQQFIEAFQPFVVIIYHKY